ncbi:hypothetical protein ACFU5O_31595 [Streptomyces sp. NPDC057445]|uniref:hypothetical protein n=1 Tax=Streptomyces sp. NPDC057445 TaxID=3346136 RepID=UPI0036A5945E
MIVRWTYGVDATVSADGWLILHCGRTARVFQYPPPYTVAWISLQRHDGDIHLAADEIASSWREDQAEILVVIERWLQELRVAGLIHEGR